MKNTFSFLLLISFVQAFAQTESNDKLVKKTFNNYKKAILEDKGAEASEWVDSKTLSFYDRMLKISLHGDSVSVQKLDFLEKLTVLMVRHRVPVNELLSMSGKDFFIYAIDQGMVGKGSVMTIDIGDVKITDNFATGQMLANGKPTPLNFGFNKENNTWKVDLTSIFPASNAGLNKMIADEGMTDIEYIFNALEMLTGRPVEDSIWKPLKN
jgi:hypothetical protein